MRVIWWVTVDEDEEGKLRQLESERHAVENFSSPITYCGCNIPLNDADVYAEMSANVTCGHCLHILENMQPT